MLSITFSLVRDGREDQLRAWGAELVERADEVRQTFRQEGVRQEKSYLIRAGKSWILVRAAEVEDWDKAVAAFDKSELRIDAEHRGVMESALEGPFPAQLIYECSL